MNPQFTQEFMMNSIDAIEVSENVQAKIRIAIRQFKRKEKSICITSPETIIEIKPSQNSHRREYRYGFPFAIFTKITNVEDKNSKVVISMTGSKLRQKQHEELIRTLGVCFGLTEHRVSSKYFLKLAESTLSKQWNEFIYIDPYQFIGDSVIGLSMADALARKVNTPITNLTQNSILRKTLYAAKEPIKYLQSGNHTKLVLMPNFIDYQIEDTFDIIKTVLRGKFDSVLLIPGRNLIVTKIDDEIAIYKSVTKEFILKAESKEQMLQNSLNVFGLQIKYENKPFEEGNRVLINPLTSNPARNFPKELTDKIIDRLDGNVIASYGSTKKQYSQKRFLHIGNSQELLDEIHSSDIVITADTGVAHIANRFNKFCIVIYNSTNWDADSILSSIHNSPMGFASRKNNFIPIIFNPNSNYQSLIDLIIEMKTMMNCKWQPIEVDMLKSVYEQYKQGPKNRRQYELLKNVAIRELSKAYPHTKLLNNFYYDFYSNSSLCKKNFKYHELTEQIGPCFKLIEILVNKFQ